MEITKKINSLACGICLAFSVISGLQANPSGATVVHGSASFSQPNVNTLNVTNSPGAIINWQQFGVKQGELTRFIQQGANSAVLNRITGQDPSVILGQLRSNGKVFLVNPNGVVFGQGSVVNTAGLIASTLDISNQDFLSGLNNGNMRFADLQNAAEILNQGFISASNGGEVVFVAPKITNEGTIRVDNGSIVLAAGQSVTINSLNYDNIEFEVQAPANKVVNLGKMVSDGGSIGVFAGSIANKGMVSANAVTVDAAGNIVFVARADTIIEDGTVTATSQTGKGGDIKILGDRVALLGKTVVDASGATGGGEVLLGGDLQGKNPQLKNSRQTIIGKEVSIAADAKQNGDGGKVIVWADDSTVVHGDISATGGAVSGDGGFVETSGKNNLSITRTPDVTASNGSGGEWLIDPNNITIVAGNGNTGINAVDPFLSTADGATLGVDLITAALTGGANVTITTGSGGAELGDITLASALELDNTVGSNTLTLSAINDININAAIQDTTAGGQTLNLVLIADSDAVTGGDINIAANIDLAGGNLDLNTPNTISMTTGIVTVGVLTTGNAASIFNISGGTLDISSDSTLSAGVNLSAGTLTGAGNVTLNGAFNWTGGILSGSGLLTTNATGLIGNASGLTISRNWNNTGTVNWSTGALNLDTGFTFTNIGTVDANAAATFNIAASSTFDNQNILNINADTVVTGGGAFDNSGTVTALAASLFMSTASGTDSGSWGGNGDYVISGGVRTINTGFSTLTAGSLNITNGTLDFSSGAAITIAPAVVNLSGGTLTGSDDITLGSDFSWTGGAITGTGQLITAATTSITINGVSALTLNRNWRNQGSVSWLAGDLMIDGGYTLTNDVTGLFSVDTGAAATLNINATNTFDNQGVFNTNIGTSLNGAGAFNNSGTINANVGTLSIATVSGLDSGAWNIASKIAITGGNRTLNTGFTVNDAGGGSIDLINGTLDSNSVGTLPVLIPFNMSGGILTGADTINISSLNWSGGSITGTGTFVTAATNLNNATGLVISRDWTSTGVLDWQAGNLSLTGSKTLTSTGTFIANAGAAFTIDAGSVFNNQGALNISSNTLIDGGGAFNHAATTAITTNPGVTLSIATATGTDAGQWNNDGTIAITGGVRTLNAGFSVTNTGTINLSGGTLDFNTGSAFTLVATQILNVSGGTLTGADDLTLAGAFNWTGGSLTGSGLLTTSAITTISNAAAKTLDRNWSNTGTVNWSAGDLALINSKTFTNNADFNANAAATLTINAGSTFADQNNFNVNTNTTISGAGVFQQNAGQLLLNTASLTIPTLTLSGGTLAGNGTVAGNVINTGGIIQPGGAGAIGTLNITGNFSQGAGGTTVIDILNNVDAAGTGYDLLAVGGQADLLGTLTLLASGGYTVANNDTFVPISYASKTANAFSIINPIGGESVFPVYNAGSLSLVLKTGAIVILWTGAGDGVDWNDPANWDVGVPIASYDASIGGSVNVTINANADANTLVLGSSASLTLGGGTFTLSNATSLDGDFTLNGGTLNTAAAITFNGAFNWNGGALAGGGLLTTNGITTLSNATGITLARNWNNTGTVNWSAGNLTIATGQTVTSSGSFNADAAAILNVAASATFANQNSFNVNTDTTISGAGVFQQNAGQLLLSNTTLTIPSLTLSGGTLAGNGTVAGNVTNTGGVIQPGGADAIGTINITGDFSQGAGGTTVIDILNNVDAAGTGYDLLAITGQADLSGILSLSATGGYIVTNNDVLIPVTYASKTAGTFSVINAIAVETPTPAYNSTDLTLLLIKPDAVFDGANGSNWDDPINWVNDALPAGGDNINLGVFNVVLISNQSIGELTLDAGGQLTLGSGGILTIGSSSLLGGTITISGGTLDVALDSTFNGDLTLTSGALQGSGNIIINGTLSWIGGSISGAGLLTTTALSTFSNAAGYTISRNWNNTGTVNWSAGNLNLTNAKSFTNNGVFNANAGAALSVDTGSVFDNQSSVSVNSNTLITGGGSFTNSGTLATAVANTLSIATNAGADSGSWIGAGNFTISGGTRILNSGFVLSNTGNLNLSGGTLDFNTGAAFTVSTAAVNLSGGILTGSDALTITNTFNWTGGSLSGTGLLTTNGLSTLSNVTGLTLDRNWDNTGTLNWDAGDLALINSKTFTNNGSFNANAAASLAINAGSTLANQNNFNVNTDTTISGAGVFQQNAGQLLLSNTTLTMPNLTLSGGTLAGNGTVAGNVINTGGVIQPGGAGAIGTLNITGSFSQGAGGTTVIDILNNTDVAGTGYDLLAIGGQADLLGTLTLLANGGYTVANNDTFATISYASKTANEFVIINAIGGENVIPVYNTSDLNIILNTGAITITWSGSGDGVSWNDLANWDIRIPIATDDASIGGSVNVTINADASANRLILGSTASLTLGSGTFTLASSSTLDGIFTLNGGILSAAAVITTNGAFNWNGGDITGAGQLTTVGVVTIASASNKNIGLNWNNTGSVDWTAGDLALINSKTFTNNGSFNANAAASLAIDAGSTFANQNNFNVNTNTTISGAGVFQQNAGQLLLSNTTLTMPTLTLSGGTLAGNGTVAGNVINTGGLIQPGGAGAIGTLNITGNFSQGAGGTTVIDILNNTDVAGTGYDLLAIGGQADLLGTLTLLANGGYTIANNDTFATISYASKTANEFAIINPIGGESVIPVYNTGDLSVILNTGAITITWSGAGDGISWNDLANWDIRIPIATDDASIGGSVNVTINADANANTLVLGSSASLTLGGGTFTLSNATSLDGSFTMNGGTFNTAAAITFNGAFNWNGGNLAGGGLLTTNGTTTLSNTAGVTLARNWNNTGTVNWAAGNLTIDTGQTFANTGSFNADAAASLNVAASATFNNQSNVNVNSDTLITGGGNFANSGTLTTALAATLSIATTTGSDSGSWSGAGNFTLSGGSRTLNSGFVLSNTGNLNLSGGTLDFNTGGPFVIATVVNMSGGTLTGNDAITLNNAFNWTGGSLAGTGQFTSSGTTTISNAVAKNIGRSWNNAGTLNWVAGDLALINSKTFTNNGSFNANAAASLAIDAGSTFANQNNFNVNTNTTISGAGVFQQNAGQLLLSNTSLTIPTLTLSGGTLAGNGTVAGNVINTGGIIQPGGAGAIGSLNITGNFSQGAGGTTAIDILNNTDVAGTGYDLLTIGGQADLLGTLTLLANGGYTVANNDTFAPISYASKTANEFVTINPIGGESVIPVYNTGDLNVVLNTGAITITWSGAGDGVSWNDLANWDIRIPIATDDASIGGSVNVTINVDANANTLVLGSSASLTLGGGTFTLSNATSLDGSFALNGGTFNTAAAITFNGAFNWNGGALAGGGLLTTNGITTLSNTVGVTLARNWNNTGTVNWAAGNLTIDTGFIFTNTGTVNANAAATFNVAAAATFDNQSVLNINGDTLITGGGTFNNSNTGAITTASATTLSIATTAGTDAGGWDNGGTIAITGGARILNTGFNVTNTGTINLSGGTLDFNTGSAFTLAAAQTLNISGGTLTGADDLTLAGAFNWTGGSLAGTGQLTSSGTTTISNAVAKNIGRNWNNTGTMNWAAGNLTLANSKTFSNSGSFNANAAATLTINAGSTFVNQSNLTVSSNTTVSGAGAFQQNAGQLLLSNATLTMPSLTLSGGTLAGNGTVAGNIINTGGVIQPGGAGAIGTLNITGSFSQGAGGTTVIDILNNIDAAGTGYDLLTIGGQADLLGTLTLLANGGYTVANNDTFAPISYASKTANAFSTINPIGGENVFPVYNAGSLSLVLKTGAIIAIWNGAGDGVSWNDPANWDIGVPIATDNASIGGSVNVTINADANANTLVLGSNASLTLGGGTFTLSNATSLDGDFILNGGTFNTAAAVTFNGAFNWNGGNLVGGGLLTSNGITTLSKTAGVTLARNWNNTGTVNWAAGNLTIDTGFTFTNTGTVNANAAATFNVAAAATFDNQSILNINGDTLITGGGIFNNSNTGAITTASATTLSIATTAGTDTGSWTGAGNFTISGGTRILNTGFVLSNTGNLNLSGGTLDFNTGSAFTLAAAQTLNVSGGTLTGADDLTLAGAFNWTGGSLTGSGLLTTSATTTISNAAAKTLDRNWNNTGTLNWAASNLTLINSKTFTNNGSFNANAAASLAIDAGSTFANQNNFNVNTNTTISGAGVFQQNAGQLLLSNTTLTMPNLTLSGGTLAGNGTVVGNLINTDGIIQPGGAGAIGSLNITGNFSQGAGGTTVIDIFNNTDVAGTGYDLLAIGGQADLFGTLTLLANGGYTVANNDTFAPISYASKTANEFVTINPIGGESVIPVYNTGDLSVILNTGAITITWSGAGDGISWNDLANWDIRIPIATDDASIGGSVNVTINADANANTLVLGSSASLTLGGGTFTLSNATSLDGDFTLNGGTFNTAAAITFNGAFNWNGGNLAGGGLLTTNGTTTLSNTAGITLARNWNNTGTVNWTAGNLTIDTGQTFANTGSFNADAAASLNVAASATFNNQSNVNVNSDTLITGGGSFINSGTLTTASATTLFIATTTGSDSGSWSGAGNFTLSGGSRTLNSGFVLSNTGNLNLSGGTLDFNTGSAFTLAAAQTLNVSGGTLTGADDLTLAGAFNWTGGSLAGTGQLTSSGTTTISNVVAKNIGRSWNNTGTLNWVAGDLALINSKTFTNNGSFNANAAASLAIDAGSTFANQNNFNVNTNTTISGAGVFQQNAGQLLLSNTTLTMPNLTLSGGTLAGNGTVAGNVINTGGLIQPGGAGAIGTLNVTGNFSQGAGGTTVIDIFNNTDVAGTGYDLLAVGGQADLLGTLTLLANGGYTVTNNDTFSAFTYGSRTANEFATINAIAGEAVVPVYSAGDLSLILNTGAITITWSGAGDGVSWNDLANWNIRIPISTDDASIGGSVNVTINADANANTLVLGSNASLTLGSGTFTLNNATSLDGSFTLNGGTLNTAAAITFNGAFNWNGGNMVGGGLLITNGLTTLSKTAGITLARNWNNTGTVNWSAGNLTIDTGQTFTNTGSFNADAAANLNVAASATFNNQSNVNVNSDTLITGGGNFANSGTLTTVVASTLSIATTTGSDSGSWSGAGNFTLSGGTRTLNSGFVLSNTGNLNLSGGTLDFNTGSAFIVSSAAVNLSGGTLTGSDALTITNTFNWTGGNLSGTGLLTTDGSSTLNNATGLTLDRNWSNNGIINWTQGSLALNGITLTNNGSFNADAADILSLSTVASTFANQNNFNVNTDTTISGTGVFQQNAGQLLLSNATLTIPNLTMSGGTLAGSGTVAGNVTNTGGVIQPGGADAIGTLNITGNFSQGADGVVVIDILNNVEAAGTGYDLLAITSQADLSGTLTLLATGGYTVSNNDTFNLISYASRTANEFSAINAIGGEVTVPAYAAGDMSLILNTTLLPDIQNDVIVLMNIIKNIENIEYSDDVEAEKDNAKGAALMCS